MKFHEYLIDENDEDGGWVDTHYFNDPKETDVEVTLGEEAKETVANAQQAKKESTQDNSDDSEAEDIESYMNDGLDDENDPVSLFSEKKKFIAFILYSITVRVLSTSLRFLKLWTIWT